MNGFDSTTNDPAGTVPGPGATTAADPWAGSNPGTNPEGYTAPGYVPPPPSPAGLPNPGLATLLGFIPGVGAMYNGQFAKGLAHVVIFAILVSLSDHVNGIFGLLVTGWIFYIVFDSYHTARARRDGLQLPDPFGLNNIGERMGMGNGPNWSDFTARPVTGQPVPPPPAPGYTSTNVPQGSVYEDPNLRYETGPQGTTYRDNTAVFTQNAQGTTFQQAAYAPGASPYGIPPIPPYTPPSAPPFGTYAAPYAPPIPPLPASSTGLPAGAFWLIGFGFFALLGTLGHRFSWSNRFLDGAIVGAVGIVLLVTRVLRARTVYPAGTAAAAWYVLRSTRIGLTLVVIGIALTCDHAGWITWDYLWPYLLIFFGVFMLLERAAHNRMIAEGPIAPFTPEPVYDAPQPVTTESSSFVPQPTPRDEEGR